MAAELDGERIKSPREWMAVALTPVVWLSEVPDRIGGLAVHLESRESLMLENQGLRKRQLQLEAQMRRYAALDAENRRIRELLDAAPRANDRVAVADIIAANHDPYRQQITLNKGARDGVYRGQAIIDASGVLGQVVQVNPATAVGLLVTDPDHGIPVEINRNGLQAIALGQGTGQSLRLPFLPANAEIQKGDLIVSSSLGGRFPAGYPVARVESVRHTPGGHFKEAIAVPAARVGQGRQALLVWSERPQIDPAQAREATDVEAQQAPPPVAAAPATAPKPTARVTPAPAAAAAPAPAAATPAPIPAQASPDANARPAPTAPGP